MAGLEKDTAGDMEVCTVVVAETCNRFQKDIDAEDEEDTAFQECSIMAFRDECMVALGWDEMQKARTEVLAELSSKTVEQIEQDTKTHSKRALLQKYEINFDKMKMLMQAKVEQIIKKAAYEGRITQYEANTIYSKMSTRPHGQKRKRQRF